MNKTLLIIFVKNPEAGKVKTRLAATIGEEAALAVYSRLLKKTREVTLAVEVDKTVYYSEAIVKEDLWENSIYDKQLQQGPDLGKRMRLAFEHAFELGYEHVCIIGSDCFDLTTDIINRAFEVLISHDSVIGPARDGGYYLLGMNRVIPELFENKNWGTDEVFIATLDDFARLNISYSELSVLNDVDTESDLRAWNSALSRHYEKN